ncbi:MAG: M6 family metalloprotease domain-containing protein, partial [Bacteroidales bacterium]
MKKKLLLNFGLFLIALNLSANYYSFSPYTIKQPDGETIGCFVSGDEYFNWLHDKEGYTIIQASDGYFYYGEVSGDAVIPTIYKVNSVNPADAGIKKWAKISVKEIEKIRAFHAETSGISSKAPHTGTLNNIVVYIRFSDDTEFTDTRQTFDDKFNLTSGISLKSYYTDVSYSQFTVSSSHYPACAMNTNLSYQDSHLRSYFQPYNATTNTNGYNGDAERTSREHILLKDAIDWINANSAVPGALNIDGDNDGYVDNVCFNVRGGNGAWASLLWAHSWSLYSYNVYINGKRVYDYTFQPETQIDVQTLCHEMFHAIGAPDLYHYSYDGLQPAQEWDLMESGFGHMGAYMKWKYANQTWISTIPEITTSGTYTLNPLASSTNNCYKIASPNSASQFFVVEYRNATGTFEGSLPGSGLLVYRIDPAYSGNASGPPDEVYIYRPNGTTSANGSPLSAFYSSGSGRTSINDGTNPSSFLQNGTSGGLNLFNVTAAGSTISFTVSISTVANPVSLTASPVSTTQINLLWQKNVSNDNVILAFNTTPTFGLPANGTAYVAGNTIPGGGTVLYAGSATSYSHTSLQAGTTYYYKLWSAASGNNYSNGITQNASTLCNVISSLPWTEGFANAGVIPSCWSQLDNQGNGQIWQFGTITTGSPNPALTGNYAYLNSDAYGSGNSQNADLISPTLNLTGYSAVNLAFSHYFLAYAGSSGKLSYSIDNGSTWTLITTFTATSANPASFSQAIVAVAGQSTVKFKWNYTGTYGYYWGIDNINITGTVSSPPTVTTTAATSIAATTASS